MLRGKPAFKELCVPRWRTKLLPHQVMSQRFAREQLLDMSYLAKIKAIYLGRLEYHS